jgi:two-component system sensor histidine kinase VicK
MRRGPQQTQRQALPVSAGAFGALLLQCNELPPSEHLVQFYDTDAFLLDRLSEFIGAGLGSGAACIVIATQAHRERLAHRLQANGLDPTRAQERYLTLDAAETLSQMLKEGSLDPHCFAQALGAPIEKAKKSAQRVHIFGEMVALLWQQGNQAAALHLETLWNELYSTCHPLTLLCAYPMSLFAGSEQAELFARMCELHTRVIPDERYSQICGHNEQMRAVSLFQQKALSLDAEIVAHQRAKERLRISESRYSRLFEASTDSVLIIDPHHGLIMDANPSLLRLLDSTRAQIVGRELWQVGLLRDQQAQQTFLQQMQHERLQHREVIELATADGAPRSVEWVSTLLQTNGDELLQCNLHDITDHIQAEEVRLHLAAIVSSSEDAILSKDLDGMITTWNAAAERMYGYSAREIVGQPVTLLFPPDCQREFTQIMERIRRGERVEHYETTRVRKDGSLLSVSVTVSPIKMGSGTIIGASAIARDISKRKELERQREAFVSLVTHELRNPLTALQGNVQLAHRLLLRLAPQPEHLEAEQQRILADVLTIVGRSQQLLRMQHRLIGDLLDLARIQEDKVQLCQEICNLVRLVEETVQNCRATHPARLITLELPVQNPILVFADRDRLQQVLSNYMTNALKFSPAAEAVRVSISLAGQTVCVSVTDRGPGLTKEQQAQVWQRFYQDSRIPVQSGWKVGLGLGLYLCQHLIHRQQGEVGVESRPGQGATFWFTLPVHSSSPALPGLPACGEIDESVDQAGKKGWTPGRRAESLHQRDVE